jgi:ABC-type glycerol-3-phosphate transport system substrate-binding protein
MAEALPTRREQVTALWYRAASRRSVLTGLIALTAAPVLAACGGAPAAPTPAPTVAPTTAPAAPAAAPAATATPAAAAKPAAGVKATLRQTHWWGEQFNQYNPIVEEKTGIKVEQENSPWGQYAQKLITQLVGGVGPDFMLLDTYWNGDFFPQGLLLPLDDNLKSAQVDMSKFNVDQKKEVGYQGKTMGLSLFTAQDIIVHIHAPLAEKAGILKELPTWGTPGFDSWDFDKFTTWLKAAAKVKSDGTVEQYGLGNSFSGFGGVHRVIIGQNGGGLFDDDWNYGETKTTVDQDATVEAMQMVADLVLKHKVAPTIDAEKAIQGGNYRAQRAVASITWSTPSVYPEAKDQAYIHMPFTKKKGHRFGANHFSINKASKNQDAAFEFIKTFLTDKDARTKFFQVSSVPAYDPLPIVQASPDGPPKTIGLINLSRIKGMSTLPQNAEGVETYPGWLGRKPQFFSDTMGAAMESVLIGKATVKEAFGQAKSKIDAELAKK